MADVRPFRAVRFDADRTGDLGPLLCPPFDEITPERRAGLLASSPYNAVRLESPEADAPGGDPYARASAQLQEWLRDGVLMHEGEAAYYVMQEEYPTPTGPGQRLSFFAAVHLEDYDRGVVLPHEYTRRGPKEDRLALMEACGANFSPIMALYRDPGGVRHILNTWVTVNDAVAAAETGDGGSIRLWALDDSAITMRIRDAMKPLPIYIADGHHRYETALAYRDRVRDRERVNLNYQASEFVLMCLVEFDDPGMRLDSFHRALSGLSGDKLSALQEQVYGLFTVESRPLGGMTAAQLAGYLDSAWRQRSGRLRLGYLEPEEGRLSLLSLRPDLPDGSLPHAPTPELYSCEPWLLHAAVLDPVLGGSSGDQAQVEFVPELPDLMGRIESGACQAAFLVPPLETATFEALVQQGQRLPPKSTYFLPKLPTGIVVNLLTGEV